MPLLYQGIAQSSAGEKRAFLKVGEQQLVLTNGQEVLPGFILAEFSLKAATLQHTNQTNLVLPFGQQKEIEVPAQ